MSRKEYPLEALSKYIPEGSYEFVSEYIHHYKIHLTITRARKSVLGDYRNAGPRQNHRISVNGNLNRYAFLLTLLHELAHLLTYEKHAHRVAAHGREWKSEFGLLLKSFLAQGIFPDDIRTAINNSLHSPAASSCSDVSLTRVLRRYDEGKENILLVEEVPAGSCFTIPGGRVFRKGPVVRKRFQCTEIPGNRIYLFSPVYEVKLVEPA
jgi:hypothetical protein